MNAMFLFMDGFSGYNQIKMADEDKSKTTFITHWGIFVYNIMPFGLKNVGATYQRVMVVSLKVSIIINWLINPRTFM